MKGPSNAEQGKGATVMDYNWYAALHILKCETVDEGSMIVLGHECLKPGVDFVPDTDRNQLATVHMACETDVLDLAAGLSPDDDYAMQNWKLKNRGNLFICKPAAYLAKLCEAHKATREKE